MYFSTTSFQSILSFHVWLGKGKSTLFLRSFFYSVSGRRIVHTSSNAVFNVMSQLFMSCVGLKAKCMDLERPWLPTIYFYLILKHFLVPEAKIWYNIA